MILHINVLAMLDHRGKQHNIIKVGYRFIGIIIDKTGNFMRYSYAISFINKTNKFLSLSINMTYEC